VRDWIRDGHLQPRGPRGQVPKAELVRLVSWLRAHAKHFNPQSYTRRLVRGRRSPAVPFATLAQAHFIWPKGRAALTPRELAGTDAAQGWQRLRELCADVVELRRGDHSAERLRLERLRLSRSGLPGEKNPTPALDPAPRSA
jgi:hypothetical protein